ncbi:MAG TPA: enolase C-terminal domain-like protein, partial [candidate division Zixibacteria bacterium]|nr:enolase C-terminal domain-like protein [candidate division Zixibacteria bacterium]
LLHYMSGESRRYPWEILQLATPAGIKSSFTIAIDNPDEMISSIRKCESSIIKIKMGNDDDISLMDKLTQVTGKEIRIDANGGWAPEKAEEMILHLSRKGVRVIEQPTDTKYIKDWKHLKGKNDSVELIADESVHILKDYHEIAEYIDGVNIKMEKCGGILEGMKIAQIAREEKKKVMLGCMVESSVGISQSVYMSSLADYFDLDGPQLLESDIAEGIRYDKESIEVDAEIIGGPKLKRDVIEKYIQK